MDFLALTRMVTMFGGVEVDLPRALEASRSSRRERSRSMLGWMGGNGGTLRSQ